MNEALRHHLQTGATTTCRCWAVTRTDGVELGFTDHDRPLQFQDITFRPETGLTAMTVERSTGLSTDNTEAIGILSGEAVREDDLAHGRYDGAKVRFWLVNWNKPSEHQLIFRGQIGAIKRSGVQFVAELHGLAEVLNRPMGRSYLKSCGVVLGDKTCRFDLNDPGFTWTIKATEVVDNQTLYVADTLNYAPHWFRFGRLIVESGQAVGMTGLIREDRQKDGMRIIELWQPLNAHLTSADTVRLEAGCDKRWQTCRDKFDNLINFQGFPDIPKEDMSATDLAREVTLNGGSRRS